MFNQMHRRNFLKNSTQSIAAFFGLSHFHLDTPPPITIPNRISIDPSDENYWSIVRTHFPLTHDRIYLNTGGLGASPYVSIEAVKAKIDELEHFSRTGHTEKLWLSVKQSAAHILGCTHEEIAYTKNTTEGVNIICNGLPLKPGDEVITSTHEHVGNTITWLARQKRDGIVIKVFEPSTDSAQENIDRIQQLITSKTRVLSISHVTTSIGQILPVHEIGKLAQKYRLWYFIDGAQSAGMLPVNISEIGCHAYATCGHKWLIGPKGTGLLYVCKDMLERIEAKWVGAYSNFGPFDMTSGEFQFNPTSQRYEYGTVSTPLFVGLGASVDFLLNIGTKNIWKRIHYLASYLIKGLNNLEVEVLSPQDQAEHSAMITFQIKDMDSKKLQSFLKRNYKLRTRSIYEGGLDAIRISLHIYNSIAEVEKIITGIRVAKEQL